LGIYLTFLIRFFLTLEKAPSVPIKRSEGTTFSVPSCLKQEAVKKRKRRGKGEEMRESDLQFESGFLFVKINTLAFSAEMKLHIGIFFGESKEVLVELLTINGNDGLQKEVQ